MKKVIAILTIVLIGVTFAWNGGGTTQPKSGDYWAFTPGDQPPQAPDPDGFPVPNPDPIGTYHIVNNPGAVQLAPTTTTPIAYTLPSDVDFWFYGQWYYHGSKLYIYPDGFMAFIIDNLTTPHPTGNLNDPTKPNAVIAPYWTDLSADGTGTDERIYLWKDNNLNVLYFEWYKVTEQNDPTEYTFTAALHYGDEGLLVDEGCGVIFSYHFIDFAYAPDGASYNWGHEDPNATIGIENHRETDVDHYYVEIPHVEGGEDIINDGRTIRFYYRKIFNYDLAVADLLAPHNIVLRYTKYAPIFVVENIGTEVVNSYNVSIDITDLTDGSNVYSNSFSRTQLYYIGSGNDYQDTVVCEPVWDRPQEIGTEYEIKITITGYAEDECVANNTYYDTVKVWCEEEYSYNFDITQPGWWEGYGNWLQAVTYALPDGVALVMGGDVYLNWAGGDDPSQSHLEVWSGDDPTDCGWDQMTEWKYNAMEHEGYPGTPITGWNEVYFQYGPMKWQRMKDDLSGVEWVAGYDALGEHAVIANHNEVLGEDYTGVQFFFTGEPVGVSCDPIEKLSSPQYATPAPDFNANAGYLNPTFGLYVDNVFSYGITMKTHLALWKPPVAPAYFEKAHDLAVTSVLTPEPIGGKYFVVADESITPQDTISNLGRQKEETSTTYPIQAFFRAVPELEDFDTYETSANIEEIDWIGGTGAFTKEIAFSDWTPEGNCDVMDASLEYDVQYIVKRNKVGPDKTDHCPYNDTVHLTVTSLWKNDAWMKEVHVYKDQMGGEEVMSGDSVATGTNLYFKCVVANTGSEQEPHDIGGSKARFVAKLQVFKDADGSSVFGPSVQALPDINWRGNTNGDPWEYTLEFPDYWTVPDQETYDVKFSVELDNDLCSKNNAKDVYIGGVATAELPANFELYRIASPAREVTVKYALPVKADVVIKVYDVTGKLVKTLVAGTEDAGYKTVTWNATDSRGRKVSAGVYYVKMLAGDYNNVQKVIIMR